MSFSNARQPDSNQPRAGGDHHRRPRLRFGCGAAHSRAVALENQNPSENQKAKGESTEPSAHDSNCSESNGKVKVYPVDSEALRRSD